MSEKIKKIETKNAPEAVGPYSQAVHVGDFLFISGQISINPLTGKIVEGPLSLQFKQVFQNIEGILAAAGGSFDNVVKVDLFLKDLNHFGELNGIYREYFTGEVKPARQTVEASKLPMGSPLEVSCIAYLGNINS